MAKLNKLYSTREIYEIRQKLIAEHGNVCGVCGKHRDEFKHELSVDHSHRSGRIRGLLCFRCNRFLVGRHTLRTAYQVWRYLERAALKYSGYLQKDATPEYDSALDKIDVKPAKGAK